MYYVQGPILGAREDTDINKNRKLIKSPQIILI